MKFYLRLAILLSLLLSPSVLLGKTFTYRQVHSMPMSVEKDYYIWRFLTQRTTTKKEAKSIIYGASRLNKKLRTAYRKKQA